MNEILYLLSDGSINDFLALLVRDYKVLTALIGGPLFWYGRKLAHWTPWDTDDAVVDCLGERLGVKDPSEAEKTP
jgi:hypothetical protein